MKIFCSILPLFLGLSTLSAQTDTLPDIGLWYEKYTELTEADDHLAAAQLAESINKDLRSSDIYLMSAIRYAKAGEHDRAATVLLEALDNGFRKLEVIRTHEAFVSLRQSPRWPFVHKRMEAMAEEMKKVESFQLDLSGVEAFWQAYDRAVADTARATQYFTEAILTHPDPLGEFYVIRYASVGNIVDATLREAPEYYAYLRRYFNPTALEPVKDRTEAAMRRFKELYPEASFVNAYPVVGILNTGGTANNAGLYIGIDMFGRSEEAPMEELTDWHHKVLMRTEEMNKMIIHELMHFQQNYQDTSRHLLAGVIGEGGCDFLVDLVTEEEFHVINEAYFEANRGRLWEEFKTDLYSQNYSPWLYSGNDSKERPADLGYTLGYFICKSYYERAEDKKAALRELLSTDDFERIVRDSEYGFLLK